MKEIEGASRPVGPTAAAQLPFGSSEYLCLCCAFAVRTARVLRYTLNSLLCSLPVVRNTVFALAFPTNNLSSAPVIDQC